MQRDHHMIVWAGTQMRMHAMQLYVEALGHLQGGFSTPPASFSVLRFASQCRATVQYM